MAAKNRRRKHHRRNPLSPARARVSNRRHRRRRNPSVKVYNRRRHHHRRRNPMPINKQLVEMAGGILIGVAASKYLPTLIPSSVLGAIPSSSFTVPLVTGIGTAMAGFLAHKFLPPGVAVGVVGGGAALTLSRLLDVIAPPSIAGQVHLSGVGDIVGTQGFSVPDRSMRAPLQIVGGVGNYGYGNYRKLRG